jgi:cell fate regulator YaaT (PSP1 superfamily)
MPATPGHARYFPNTSVGTLVREASPEDEAIAAEARGRSLDLFDEANRHFQSLALPALLLDAEVLFDRENAALQFVRWGECDFRPLVSALSIHLDMRIILHDLTKELAAAGECGSCGEGGCGSCGEGGCGTCGSAEPEELRAHFLGLREQMIASNRMPLI